LVAIDVSDHRHFLAAGKSEYENALAMPVEIARAATTIGCCFHRYLAGPMTNPVQQLILCQDRLYAFALALLGDANAAEDVLQETNLAATERLGEAGDIADFTGWLFGVARHQVQEHRRRQARQRLRFSDDLLDVLASELAEATSDLPPRQRALRGCLDDLPQTQRDLILRRYDPGISVQWLAADLKKTTAVISQTLYRIRLSLLACIQGKLASEGVE
jgi:RNA polymerase sigma-70 factor (ECF subfamily)